MRDASVVVTTVFRGTIAPRIGTRSTAATLKSTAGTEAAFVIAKEDIDMVGAVMGFAFTVMRNCVI